MHDRKADGRMPETAGVDLTNCDREPIHVPGRVQGFGCMLAMDEPGSPIQAASANAEQWLGVAATALLGRRLPEFEGLDAIESAAAGALRSGVFKHADLDGQNLAVSAHRSPDGRVVVEIEAGEADAAGAALAAVDTLASLAEMAEPARDLLAMARRVVDGVREITGFDRVKLYRFDEQWHGQVIAESRGEGAASYLGLWFPASDIPARARAMYELSPVRLIADLPGEQSPVLHAPGFGEAVDMSRAVLRGVSPVHVEYLSNMGVASSLTLSVRRAGRLWGLIACHGSRAMVVGPSRRRALGSVASMVSQLLTLRAESDQARAEREFSRVHAGLVSSLARLPNSITALREHAEALMASVGACGFAVRLEEGDGLVEAFGRTPPVGVISEAMRGAGDRAGEARVYATRSMREDLGVATESSGVAGMLAGAIGEGWASCAAWFRPEVVETATWAGQAEKQAEADGRLSPRKSFEAWKQTVRGRSAAWTEVNLAAVGRLCEALREFDDAAELREMVARNQALSERNSRLGHFVDSVAHDLRAPLVSIGGYSDLLRGRLSEGRTPMTEELLQRIDEAGTRMRALLEDLLRIARLDELSTAREPVSLREAAERAAAHHAERAAALDAVVELGGSMPTVRAPRVYIDQAMENLIGNALKYGCPEPGMRVRVSAGVEGESVVLRVADDGPGVPADRRESVFQLFRRLHNGGEGTGAGLFLVHRLATLLGGDASVEDGERGGAVFVVRLPGSMCVEDGVGGVVG